MTKLRQNDGKRINQSFLIAPFIDTLSFVSDLHALLEFQNIQ